jgi:hypothetical protein
MTRSRTLYTGFKFTKALEGLKSMNTPLNLRWVGIAASGAISLACVWLAGSASRADTGNGMLPPGYSLSHTGDTHDFDYFAGGWITKQRRLKARGVGSSDWEDFPAVECLTVYLGGLATVDELYIPSKMRAGLTLRAFDVKKHQWSIYWVSSTTGQLDPVPVVGGFDGNRGEFYADDQDNGRPIRVRYLWSKLDHEHARWEQAFSYDNQTWETNWIAEFTRADASKICENGRPKR